MQLTPSRRVAYTAVFTALALIANIFTIDTGLKYFMISFLATPCFFAGVMLGPLSGFAVGMISDLLGALIHPLGPYNVLIGIASGLLGFIPGVVFRYLRGNAYVKAAVSFALCLIVCTAGLNTYALFVIYSKGKTFFAYLGVRLPFQIIVSAINCFITVLLIRYFRAVPALKIRI